MAAKPQTREYLASIFWRDSNRKSAYTSLRVAIYELRKSLASTEFGFDKESALLEEKEEGFFKNTLYHIKSDAQEFESLYHLWKSGKSEFDPLSLLKLCRLYTGSFLENGDYDDWAMLQSSNYTSMYFEAVHSLGRLLFSQAEAQSNTQSNVQAQAQANAQVLKNGHSNVVQGSEDEGVGVEEDAQRHFAMEVEAELERALVFDPLDEECCSILLSLYHKSNQSDRAKVLEKHFRRRFKKEMGVEAQLFIQENR